MIRCLVSLGFMLLAALPVLADPVLRWEQSSEKLLVGESMVLSVMLDDTLQVRTLELRVRFDPTVLASVAGEPGQLFDGLDLYPGFSQPEGDTWYGYCVVLGADDWAQGPGELFRWTVRGVEEGSSDLATVEVSLRPPGGDDYPDVTLPSTFLDVGDLTAAPHLPAVANTLRVFPNPFNPRTSIAIEGCVDGRLEVLDARGCVVATPWIGRLDGERKLVPWDGCDARGRAAPSGVYLFRLVDDETRVITRGVLLR